MDRPDVWVRAANGEKVPRGLPATRRDSQVFLKAMGCRGLLSPKLRLSGYDRGGLHAHGLPSSWTATEGCTVQRARFR
jgi:hypothetical protein